VNADYLQRVADHRFGKLEDGEQYLDKFVDIRLKLPERRKDLGELFGALVSNLPEYTPLHEVHEFSRNSAIQFAKDLVNAVPLTMRQIKRLVSKLDLIIRMNAAKPIDLHLLILLSVKPILRNEEFDWTPSLPRILVTPDFTRGMLETDDWGDQTLSAKNRSRALRKKFPEVFNLPNDVYGIGPQEYYDDWYKVAHFLAPRYIPLHQGLIDAVHHFEVEA